MYEGMGNRVCIVMPLFYHRIPPVLEEMALQIQPESLMFFCLHMPYDVTPLALLFVFVKLKTERFFFFVFCLTSFLSVFHLIKGNC